ncbi:hypothetical protein BiPBO1_55 [Brucella phage BiPBO1]|uniref:hypothetical protein n=1 Tax=Brucella phage BiPBO1 TaxID=1718278 RepID=UPI00046CEF44|nr:hypothetical protein [Brucella inopinata]YP_009304083.1 hypothetical protein BJD47_gp55 [Brucella phage BiPBO1]ALJ98269.1 hypothetical protein BiPBO1_55 [Brucella phage BiPBO1]KEY03805.1 hypothetical protein IL59_0214365 [Brucella suis bv. 4 str. 40]
MSKIVVSYSEETSKHSHRLRVVRYNETFRCHECVTDEGQNVLVDVFIDGTLPKTWNDQNIIGQTVEVAYTHGFVWLASEPRIVEEAA